MNLFIDSISREGNIIIFDNERKIKDSIILNLKGNESSILIPTIDKLLKKNNLEYGELDNIIVVNGPGSFTGIRTTVLAVNTINFIIKKHITDISYFELFDNYPIIKSSSKRDCFFKNDKNSRVKIINNDELIKIINKKKLTKVYGEVNPEIIPGIKVFEKIDYKNIIVKIKFKDFKKISPLYIKKPNIS